MSILLLKNCMINPFPCDVIVTVSKKMYFDNRFLVICVCVCVFFFLFCKSVSFLSTIFLTAFRQINDTLLRDECYVDYNLYPSRLQKRMWSEKQSPTS